MVETISADTFIERLLDGSKGALTGREVRGNVSLRGQKIEASLRALDLTFWGEVDFSDCRFERSLDLSGCSFAKTINLRNSHVGGTLDLAGISVRTEGSATRTALAKTVSLDLRGMRIGGDLDLSRVTVEYGTDPDKSADRGGVLATGIRVGGRTSLYGIKTDNFVRFSGSTFIGEFAFGDDEELGTRDGSASLGRELALDNCNFGGNLVFAGGAIGTDLQLWSSKCDGVFFIRPYVKGKTLADGIAQFTVFGEANLANIKFDYIDIEGLIVRQNLRIFAAEIGQIKVAFGNSMVKTTIGRLELDQTQVVGNLSLHAIHVTGNYIGSKAKGARLNGLVVGGDLSFWSHLSPIDKSDGRIWPHAPRADQLRAVVNGDLEISGCKIGGELDLTNVLCSGRIRLDDSNVTRDVLMRSTLTGTEVLERVGLHVSEDARTKSSEATVAPRPILRTTAVALSMNNLSCDNDVDLTGLTLAETEPTWIGDRATLRKPDPGHVGAENVRVGRSLRLFEPCNDLKLLPRDSGCKGEGIIAPGAIDLSGSKLGELVVSRHSFESTDPGAKAAEVGVVLAGATVDEVSIVDLACASRRSLKLPRPIDLRDVSVGQWNIFDEKAPLLARRWAYHSLAATDDRFRRSTWLSLERSLRNQGHSADADFIFRQMERHEEREGWRDARSATWRWLSLPVQTVKWFFLRLPFGLLLGYGTQPFRLLVVIVCFWLASLPFYLMPENYEPSLQMLGADDSSFMPPVTKPLAGTSPTEWPISAGIMTSIGHHVPVIAIAPREKWMLRDSGDSCYSDAWLTSGQADDAETTVKPSIAAPDSQATPKETEVCAGWSFAITPQDFGLLARILNFIAWPFVLAFAINRFVRIGRD